MISYGKCTKAQYEALTPVQDRIYYITDTGEQFLNGLPYNGEDNKDYLCLTARQASTTVSLDKSNASMSDVNLEYSTDKRNWTKYTWDSSTGAGTTITLSALGDKVYFRGDNTTFTSSSSNRFSFTITGKADPSGNIMSLLDKTCELKEIPDTGGRMFYMLFGSDRPTDTIVDASGLRLPATTLAAYCYGSLFAGQTGLTTANFELPAVTMKDNCYRGMFNGCQSLALPPELPATILATGCYSMMFRMCNALVKAPKLPATTLAQNCYESMFMDCGALSQVEVSFTDWQSSYAPTSRWVRGVSTTGVFKCPSTLDTTTRDASYVPAGWSVIYTDVEASKSVPSATASDAGKVLTVNSSGNPEWDAAQGGEDTNDYLCFTAGQANSTVNFKKDGNPDAIDIEYSTNNKESWNDYTWATNDGLTITLNSGDSVYFRAKSTNAHMGKGWSDYHFFRFNGIIYASGNVMSLLDKTCKLNEVTDDFCFLYLFSGFNQPANNLYSAPELPAKKLAGVYCYANMFYQCTHLTAMPELPATILSEGCYDGLFGECTSLNVVKSIPIATLAPSCFSGMFSRCTSLRRTPDLPSLELATNCYQRMFAGCTSLESAGALPATTLAEHCYYGMFERCTNLKKVPKIYATTFMESCCERMFYDCQSLVDGDFGVPVNVGVARVLFETFYACPSLAVAPKFTGDVVGTYAFIRAFAECTSLHYLKASWTSWNQQYPSSDWFDNASTTGVFDCPSTLDTTTYVPSGWTVTHGANEPSDDTTSVAEATDTTIYTVCPGSKETGVVTVSNTLTLNAYPATSTDIAYAEVVLDIASGATVTAGTNLTLVDTPTAGKRNVCVVRWSGGVAKLYVTIVEDLPQA